ncbi:MAG: hypothetical protein SF182_17685, partial [Deltaproteobacteria bacterium]|nr:hypothetical protein [Deltaproteobacteria bacterium]
SNVQITDVTDTTITIEWDTDEPATSGVSFNDGVVYDVLSDPTLVLHHVMTLSSLTLGTTYHLTVSSTDVIGNGPSVAGPVDATTGAPCYDAGVACDDGNACTDGDVCDGAGGCAGSAITCNDGSSCTRDSCEPLAGCVYTVEPLPAASCRNPGRSVLVLKDNGDDSRDHVLWKWLLGDTPLSAFGAPTSATSYGLCVYDDAFGSYRAVMNAEISPVAGWTPFPRGFTYLDKTRSRQGVQKLHLLQGAGTKSKVLFVGHGAALNLPLPGTALPLWQTSQVVVQLSNSDGECWQSTFAAPARRNQPGVFRDVAP